VADHLAQVQEIARTFERRIDTLEAELTDAQREIEQLTKLLGASMKQTIEVEKEIEILTEQRNNHLNRLLKEREEHEREIEQLREALTMIRSYYTVTDSAVSDEEILKMIDETARKALEGMEVG
jgi:predicted RNase H-like nuclease (RuvC/YqgF family)